MCHYVFPYNKEGKDACHIMMNEKNHSIVHCGDTIANWGDSINMSGEAPETAHKKWIKDQGGQTNQKDSSQVTMMKHCILKEAAAELCEAVQARIEDGISGSDLDNDVSNPDDWNVRGQPQVPLRADRWFQVPEESIKGTCEDISCTIWERAKIRRNITHRLAGGGHQNKGYFSVRWDVIGQGRVDPFGMYAVTSVLPEKIAKFLFEFHGDKFQNIGLPILPPDRSDLDVHGMLTASQASDHSLQPTVSKLSMFYIFCIF
jgi:hypothetical protein